MQRTMLILTCIAALAIGVFASVRMMAPPERPEIGGYILDAPRLLPEFSLTDANGNEITNESFKGDWSFLYFGYTYCPDVCPISLAELARVKREFETSLPDLSDHYYLVSVDPARDTPERLREYVSYFDPDFRGVSGKDEEIAKFALAAAVVYEVPESPEDENYIVGHSSSVTIIDPKGRVYAIFTQPHTAAQIIEDFPQILEYYESM